jgi:hypothetical protein
MATGRTSCRRATPERRPWAARPTGGPPHKDGHEAESTLEPLFAGEGDALTGLAYEPFDPIKVRKIPCAADVVLSGMGVRHGGGRGLPRVSPGPAMPDPSMPCGRPPLKRPYGRFRGGPPARRAAWGRLLSPWIPHAARFCSQGSKMQKESAERPVPKPAIFTSVRG